MAIDQLQSKDGHAGSAKWLLARKSMGKEKFWVALIFFLNKFKQKAVHIAVENYIMQHIPNYFILIILFFLNFLWWPPFKNMNILNKLR